MIFSIIGSSVELFVIVMHFYNRRTPYEFIPKWAIRAEIYGLIVLAPFAIFQVMNWIFLLINKLVGMVT